MQSCLRRNGSYWRRPFSSSTPAHARRKAAPSRPSRLPHSLTMLEPDPLYDAGHSIERPPSQKRDDFGSSVRVWNDPPPYEYISDLENQDRNLQSGSEDGGENGEQSSQRKREFTSREMIEQYDPKFHLPVATDSLQLLHRYPLVEKRVVHQTGKGRIAQFYALTVVGNGKGLMGYGEGKGEDIMIAKDKAFVQAVRSMDVIDRYESRTLWTTLETKFGATKVIMRPRPVGFGLQCNPNIHQVCKAAGIKDLSAKVWGSRNPMNVIKATCKLLHAGNAHLNMGDGIGGKGRRLDKGSGMRGRAAMEIERGRKIVDYRTW